MKKLLLPALSILLTACQTAAPVGDSHCPPVPRHLLTEKAAPTINLPADASSRQVIDEGIRPLHQWGEEGWARVRQIRQLQEQCEQR